MTEAKVETQREMIYTVPLKYAWYGPHNDRTRKAVDILKKFIMRHMKVKEVKITQELNEKLWERGMKNPPRRIRVRAAKVSEELAWVTLPEHKFQFEMVKKEEKEEAAEKPEEKKAEGEEKKAGEEKEAEKSTAKMEEKEKAKGEGEGKKESEENSGKNKTPVMFSNGSCCKDKLQRRYKHRVVCNSNRQVRTHTP